MPRYSLIAALILAAGAHIARANEGPAPLITHDSLVGVWEAAPSWAQRVYRLDIAAHGDSYLAFTYGADDLVFRLTSSRVKHGKILLHFHSVRPRREGCDDLVIAGSGCAYGDFGTFGGTLRMYDALYPGGRPEPSTVQLSFTKPPWTRELTHWSEASERLIQQVRATP